MRLTKYILLMAIMAQATSLMSQSKKAYLAAAENAFYEKDYYSSMIYYQNALEFEDAGLDINYRYAQSARKFDAYNLADSLFTHVIQEDEGSEYPLSAFYLGEMKQMNGDYSAAIENYNLYLSLYEGDNDYYTAKAQKEVEACEWAINQINTSNPLDKVIRLGDDVNTQFSDFGAVEVGDSLYFSSLRFQDFEGPFNPDRLLSKILLKGGEGAVEKLSNPINDNNQIIAHSSFSDDLSVMIYTVCAYEYASDIRCDLYYTPVNEQMEMTGPGTKLPAHINLPQFTQTQPMLYNGYLYFVSDREDGEGGMDIWRSEYNPASMNFAEPENMSEINTTSDEITPFYDVKDDHLYFSSNGYIGFGGYDVYKSEISSTGFGEVKNLGHPINSSFHDLYYFSAADGNIHFSSNRTGSMYIEAKNEACCYDIYNLEKSDLEISLNAQSYNAVSLDSLIGVNVRLIDDETGEELASFLNMDGKDHLFSLDRDRSYLIIGDKTGYISDTLSFTTYNISSAEEIIKKLFLTPDEIDLNLTVFDEETRKDLTGATITVVDIDEPNNPIVITNFDGNDFNFKLLRGRKYRITTSRDGYESSTMILDTNDYPNEDSISKKIFLKRRSDPNYYLPLTLFFDNDYPNPKSWSRRTNRTYSETYFPYVNKKEEFKSNYSEPLNGDEKNLAEQEVESFFSNELEYNYNQLQILLDVLHGRLAEGEDIVLKINGHASPKYKSNYNNRLSERRIKSVKNELSKFKEGLLKAYIDSGQLGIEEMPYGEDQAPGSVSDSQTDRRNSVYSPEASRERKTVILRVETNNEIN